MKTYKFIITILLGLSGCGEIRKQDAAADKVEANPLQSKGINPPSVHQPVSAAELIKLGDPAACLHPDVEGYLAKKSRYPFDDAHAELGVSHEEYASVLPPQRVKRIRALDGQPTPGKVVCIAWVDTNLGNGYYEGEFTLTPSRGAEDFAVTYDAFVGDALRLAQGDDRSAMLQIFSEPKQ